MQLTGMVDFFRDRRVVPGICTGTVYCYSPKSRQLNKRRRVSWNLRICYVSHVTFPWVYNDMVKRGWQPTSVMFVFTQLALLITFSRPILGLTPVRGTAPVQLSDSFEVLAIIGNESLQGPGGTGTYHCVSDICGQGKFVKFDMLTPLGAGQCCPAHTICCSPICCLRGEGCCVGPPHSYWSCVPCPNGHSK